MIFIPDTSHWNAVSSILQVLPRDVTSLEMALLPVVCEVSQRKTKYIVLLRPVCEPVAIAYYFPPSHLQPHQTRAPVNILSSSLPCFHHTSYLCTGVQVWQRCTALAIADRYTVNRTLHLWTNGAMLHTWFCLDLSVSPFFITDFVLHYLWTYITDRHPMLVTFGRIIHKCNLHPNLPLPVIISVHLWGAWNTSVSKKIVKTAENISYW